MTLPGRVIEEQKNYYIVDTEQSTFRCTIRGVLKKNRVRVCTGDLVTIDVINQDSREAVIAEVQSRSSFLKRPALANLTQILFVNTFKHPSLDTEALDRFLFASEVYQIPAVIVFNKTDLLDYEEQKMLDTVAAYYEKTGYRTIFTSARKLTGMDELKAICRNQVSACAGLSGVGKSTLLSLLFPDRNFRTANVSGAAGRGTHTTTSIVLFPFESGYIADTPGFSFVDIPPVDENDVVTFFPELVKVTGSCRFNNCIHNGEPGCAVQELIDTNEILDSRRAHFLKIFNELKARRQKFR
ncbi:MAG TPA: ribosome small subunit-dependent GTPase A [Chitinispirillaceae bacterium]|nr:ribosome small subunit-dependent GTPase A [Chitinispirillaceae bacterium]